MPNRRHWDEQLPRELGRSLRYDEPVCVAMLDLDRFKEYNDTYGHQAGDRLLKEVTAAWRTVLRPYDLLARYGGEEFSLTLMGCELDDAVREHRAAAGRNARGHLVLGGGRAMGPQRGPFDPGRPCRSGAL